jgi:hypothetical protein
MSGIKYKTKSINAMFVASDATDIRLLKRKAGTNQQKDI